MKRSHSSMSIVIQNDESLLESCTRLENHENDSSQTLKIEKQQMSQSNEIELCNSVIEHSATTDDNNKSVSYSSDDEVKSPKKESNNVENPVEKKGEMLLEAISSDDDIAMDSDEDGVLDSDIGEHFNDYTDDVAKEFVPSLFQATPLRSIQDPSLSVFEYIHRKLNDDSKCAEVAELINCLEYLNSKIMNINEKWIITAERTVEILPKTLSNILNISEYCHKLFSLIDVTLDFTCASKAHASMSTFIIRHLKVGLKLIEALCQYNEDLSEHLIKHHQIHNNLINLFFVEHMSLSLKLNILRALDSSLNGSEPIRLFLYTKVFDDLNGYQTLLKILSLHQRPRVCFIITSILRKVHFYELLQKLNTNTNMLDSNSKLLLQECLAEITTTYIKAPILMGCPKRFLQAHAQFELTPALTHFDVYPTIYRLFDDSSLINCITKLLVKSNFEGLLEQNILKLLQNLVDCDHGLRYLGCRHKELNELIKILNKVNSPLKLTLVYKIKVLALVDYLSNFWECNLMHNFKLDLMESVDVLHDMFLLAQSTNGKNAVVNVLTMGDNFDVILNFFKYMDESRSKTNDLHVLYSKDLIKLILENSEDISYLKKYGLLIYELACKHNCFNDLTAWTIPAMKHSVFFHDDVGELCNIVKNNINNCVNLNKTLITSLRILKYLGVPNDEIAFEGVEDFVELKYKYITLQMYSYDMLGNLLTIIDKICDSYKYPSVNVCLLTGNRGKIITYVIRPSMVLIRYMITLLIQSRGNAFKDLSPIKTLLKLYNLMYYVPECSSIREDAIKVSKDINKILEIYVGIKIGSSMINELLVWTLSSPSVFSSSLSLLCNLLPSPLPIQTLKPLDESVVTTMISFRNMWIEHLGKCNKDLVELITVLGSSNFLLQPLKWLCIKISNLNMSMSLLIAQTLLDFFINIDNDNYFNTYLNLLLQLCDNKKYVIIKSAVIQILNEEKSKESYNKFVEKLCENIQQKKQEKSIIFVRCLCNSDIILDGNDVKENLPRGSAPNGWILNNILKALLSSFESHTLSSTQSLIVETCIMIINSDYGFYQFKIVLDTFSKPFFNILNYLTQVWNKEDTHCVNTLMLIIQLINLCIKNDINTKRLLFMNMSQLKEYLNWTNNVKDHPICLLKEIIKEQNSICYQNLISLIELLNNEQDSITEFIEPQLATNDFLTDMFKDRLFYNICINEENCLNHNNDTNEPEVLIECNVEEIVSDWPDFNIKNKINDLFKIEDCIAQPELISHKQQEPIITEKKENSPNTSVIPMPTRHKVFSRLGTVQRPDIFRNRLPNTSRPPSLHVDEFVAMETRSVRQPPRYKSPIQPIQDLNIRLHERHMAYQRSYNLYNPYKSHLSLHSWHAQVNALAHLRADYRQTINSRHLELQRHSLVAEWRQLRVEAVLRKKRAYLRR